MRTSLFAAAIAGTIFFSSPAVAQTDKRTTAATFALVVGANRSVDAELAPLKYADDDAARYLDLFRLLGAHTVLLTRLDDNTRALHPQAAAEALEPKRASFDAAVAQLARDVAQAASRHVETTVYVVYAGHGNVKDGQGYITLEDARITGAELADVLRRIPATRIHLIADACASYFLAYSRGPGGQRRPIESLSSAPELSADPRVGFLLSTSSARESHEWEAFQSGVFSHEVRSGLYGAADADGDGVVTYREIAAFVTRANASIPNERYRPDVFTRAPKSGEGLVDLRKARGRRLEIDGKHAGHYYLEDGRGVRILDLHNTPLQTLSVVRPPPTSPVYLRRVDDEMESLVPAGEDVVTVADLAPEDRRVASRGAAHESFSKLFELPFDRAVVDAFRQRPIDAPSPPVEPARGLGTQKTIALGALGAGAVLAGTAVVLTASASATKSDLAPNASHADAAAANDEVAQKRTWATVGFVAGGAALAAGVTLFLWKPSSAARSAGVSAYVLPGSGFVGYGGTFR